MKELTHEDWMNNPIPRMMWVWDSSEERKKQRKVIYFSEENITYPVVALTGDDTGTNRYEHCSEITEPRRMTNKELSRWLRENTTREFKYFNTDIRVRCEYSYYEIDADKEVGPDLVIRENDGEWREPLIGVEE